MIRRSSLETPELGVLNLMEGFSVPRVYSKETEMRTREGGENGDGKVREDNLEGPNKVRDIESLEEREETTILMSR